MFKPGARYENYRGEPDVYVSLRRAGQITFELIKARPELEQTHFPDWVLMAQFSVIIRGSRP